MGERKVINKYIPADFDPKLVPRSKKPKDRLVPVRMMLPFSIQCSTCGTFMYRGRKFNSQKEPMQGPDGKYLGIQRFRFYIKCTQCARHISFLTDPKNADYEMESGATRNYELRHDETKTNEEISKEKEEAEKADPMKALENRVLDSQREMQDLDNLEEIKAMNKMHLQMSGAVGGGGFDSDAKAVMKLRMAKEEEEEKEEDLNEHGLTADEEAIVQGITFGEQRSSAGEIKRLDEEDEIEMERQRERNNELLAQQQKELTRAAPKKTVLPFVKIKRKRVVEPTQAKKTKVEKIKVVSNNDDDNGGGLGSLLGGYGTDSDSD